jgi:hypothetical protein
MECSSHSLSSHDPQERDVDRPLRWRKEELAHGAIRRHASPRLLMLTQLEAALTLPMAKPWGVLRLRLRRPATFAPEGGIRAYCTDA